MKSLLLATIIAALKAYVGGGLFQRILALVVGLADRQELSGQEKMALVLDTARREAMGLGETLVRAVVEVILLKLKAS